MGTLRITGGTLARRLVKVPSGAESRGLRPTSDKVRAAIFDKLTKVAQRANRLYGFDLLGFTEDMQFTMYDRPGAFYDWHQDGLEGEMAGRKLSLVVQLSDPDDYAGGELQLFNIIEDIIQITIVIYEPAILIYVQIRDC